MDKFTPKRKRMLASSIGSKWEDVGAEFTMDPKTIKDKLPPTCSALDCAVALVDVLCSNAIPINDLCNKLTNAGLKAVANDFEQPSAVPSTDDRNQPIEQLDSKIQTLIEEGTLLLRKFNLHHLQQNDLQSQSIDTLIKFEKEAAEEINEFCKRVILGIGGGRNMEELCLIWIKTKRVLFNSKLICKPTDVYLSHADDRKDSMERLGEQFSNQYNMKTGFTRQFEENWKIEYSLMQSESALVLLSEAYLASEVTIRDLLVLKVRAANKLNLSHCAVLNDVTEEPDRDFIVIVAKNFNSIEYLNPQELFRNLISTYQNHNYKSLQRTFFETETIFNISRSIKPTVENWVFFIFSKTSGVNGFQVDEALGTLEIHRNLNDGKMSVTVQKINYIQDILEPTWLNRIFVVEFEKDERIRIGALTFKRILHGKTNGSLKIGNKDYDCYAARFSFDPKPEWLKNCLISKFPNLREITNFLDYKSFANAPYKSLICVSGSQNISDREILKKLFNELAICAERKIIYCGSRIYEKENIICGFYRILDWGVMLWFEEEPQISNKMAKFDTLKPNAVTFLQLRTSNDHQQQYCFSPIDLKIPNGLTMTPEEYSNITKECKYYCYFPSNANDARETLVKLCNKFQSPNFTSDLDEYFTWLLESMIYNERLDPKMKLLGFDLCYSQVPRPSIIPIHPIVLSYAVISFLQRKMMLEVSKNVKDETGTITAKSKAALGDTLQNPSAIIDAAQELNVEVILPAKDGSTIFQIKGTRALCHELELMHFVSTIDGIPFRPLGFDVDDISWNPIIENEYWVSEVINSKIERANKPNNCTICSGGTASNGWNCNTAVGIDAHRMGTMLYWIVANLSILDCWESFGNPTPLRGESFVPLKFTARNSKTVNSSTSDIQNSKTISSLLNKMEEIPCLEIPHAILIQGHAGQGKTTLLRRLSFLIPSKMYSTFFEDHYVNFKHSLSKFPGSFIQDSLNLLKTGLDDYDFTNKSVGGLVDWIKELEDEDLLFEYSAVFCVVLCKEIYQLLQSSKDFVEIWRFIKNDPSYIEIFSTKVVELLNNFVDQSENIISEQDRWNNAALFMEYFGNFKLGEIWNIALFVRSDQLWQSRKIWELYDIKSAQFMKLLLKFHIENMKINDEKSQYKLLESDSMFDGMLNLLVADETKIVLMMDAVDEVSIGERSTREFKDFIQNILGMCKGNSRKIHKLIITGRYSCLQPIPERLDTVEIISLTKSQSRHYIQSLLKRWHQEKIVENFPNQVIDLKNKLNIEGSPLILLLLTRVCYLKRENSTKTRRNWLDSLTYYGVYEELIISLFNRCMEEKPSLLKLPKGLKMDRQWVLDMFSLFGFIAHLVGSQQGVTVIRKCDIAFLFEQFRADGCILPSIKIDLPIVMKSSLPNEKSVKEDSCTDEYLVTWCMIALGIVSSTARNPNDRLDDIVQFHHRTFQEFLAARTLSRFEEIKSSGSSHYPAFNTISIIENFNWTEDKFVCSDWWDVVRKFIVSKNGIEFFATKIIPNHSDKKGKSNAQIWADNIIKNGGVDYNDLGHVRLTTLLSCLSYCNFNDVLEYQFGQVLISIGNSNAKAMCSILEVSAGILKDSNRNYLIDQNTVENDHLTIICTRVFKGLDYNTFSQILISETSNTLTVKCIQRIFQKNNEIGSRQGKKQEITDIDPLHQVIKKLQLRISGTPDHDDEFDFSDDKKGPKDGSSIATISTRIKHEDSAKFRNESVGNSTGGKRIAHDLSGKSSKDLCHLLAEEQSTFEIHQNIWEMECFMPSIEELSNNVFQRFPISVMLSSLSPSGKAAYIFHRYMKLSDCDNCGSHLNERESIEKAQQLFEQNRKLWPLEFMGKLLDWNVVLHGNWYPWIENLLTHSSNARYQCGKVVSILSTKQLLFCQPYFIHLSKVWRRFIMITDTMIDADPRCRHDEVKYVAPPLDNADGVERMTGHVENSNFEMLYSGYHGHAVFEQRIVDPGSICGICTKMILAPRSKFVCRIDRWNACSDCIEVSGHSSEYRGENRKHLCSRAHAPDGAICNHGPDDISSPHWSCCGETHQKGKGCLRIGNKESQDDPYDWYNYLRRAIPALIIENSGSVKRDRKVLGKGGFGTVYQGTYNGEIKAIKVISELETNKESIQKTIMHEVKTLANLKFEDCPYMPNLTGFLKDVANNEMLIVMELLDYDLGGLLTGEYKDEDEIPIRLTDDQKLRIAKNTVKGLKWFHDKGRVHRDIKPANIMVRQDLKSIVFIDFQTSCGSTTMMVSKMNSSVPAIHTAAFCAPETDFTKPPAKEQDIFSLGMTLYYLFINAVLFIDLAESKICHMLAMGKRPPLNHPNEKVNKIIEGCWDQDPVKRLTIAEIDHLLSEITKI